MSNYNLPRIAGIAGIASAIVMLAMTAVVGDGLSPSPLLPVFLVIGGLLGIVLTAGLYLYYREEEGTWSGVAAAAALIGYLLFIIIGLLSVGYDSPMATIADILIYVVGLPLFSWLAYRTGKMSRILAIVGFVAGIAGLLNYSLILGFGVDWTNPNDPLAGVVSILYMPYLFGVIIWLVWTGYSLFSVKTQPALA